MHYFEAYLPSIGNYCIRFKNNCLVTGNLPIQYVGYVCIQKLQKGLPIRFIGRTLTVDS